ncbi:hypothetical protein GCM10020000_37180 [Streptomyces olivoverticillatus]
MTVLITARVKPWTGVSAQRAQEVHADVALPRLVQAHELDAGGVVALGQEGRAAVGQPEEGVVVRAFGDLAVLVGDLGHVGVLHHPERRLGVGHPAVQQLGVGLRVERAQRELAEPAVSAGEGKGDRRDHERSPSGAPNSWKAIDFSTA